MVHVLGNIFVHINYVDFVVVVVLALKSLQHVMDGIPSYLPAPVAFHTATEKLLNDIKSKTKYLGQYNYVRLKFHFFLLISSSAYAPSS